MEKKKHGILAFLTVKGRMWLLLGGVLAGICLIVMGGFVGKEDTTVNTLYDGESTDSLLSYEAQLEKELASLCNDVAGVSHAHVMLHVSGGMRVVYATDQNGKPVTVGNGSAEKALHDTVFMPEVAGVAIVCRGGNDPLVQRKLIDLISTALGIPSNRVAVTGK